MIRTVKKENELSNELSLGSRLYQMGSWAFLQGAALVPSQEQYNITISHEKKFIWFRVAKVGTRSIFDVLKNEGVNLDAEHSMFCHYPPGLYKDYFKFAFVRNPWDRLVSCWKNKVLESNYFELPESRLAELQDFGRFVDFVAGLDIATCDHHIRLQSKLIDLNNIDFVGRFENFEKDFREVMEIIGISPAKISKINVSEKKTHYREHYTEELAQKTAKIYRRDINIFNYGF